MANLCTICAHPSRRLIDEALVANEPQRAIAGRYGVARSSLQRHAAKHLSQAVASLPDVRREYREVRERTVALSIAGELGRIIDESRQVSASCMEWLQDPRQPGRIWLGPRAEEMDVVYSWEEDGKRRSRREPLPNLIARLESGLGIAVERVQSRHADPRELLLKSHATCIAGLDRAITIIERAWEVHSRTDAAAKIAAMPPEQIERELRQAFAVECALSERAVDGLLTRLKQAAQEAAMREAERALEEMDADV